ncbi:MAG: hypothetical protein JEY91_15310 [Spirochaetaceae bacterium]|nr:hypothetical protein [Spirochaetaceae bacterium]
MKKNIVIIALSFILCTLSAEVFFAEVDGLKVEVLNINLKEKYSNPIGASSPNRVVDLTAGLSGEAIGSISIEEADVTANELSFDFTNEGVQVKAWAYNDNDSMFYFTTASGTVGSSGSSTSAAWTGYDYMTVPAISPDRTDGRMVIQSYFPEPEFIGADSAIVVTGSVDLDYTVLFWDGDNTDLPSSTPFAYYPALYPSGTATFAVTAPDVVLGINTSLTKEVYAFSQYSNPPDPLNTDCKVVSLFFDDDGNLYDGAVKKETGYSSGATWQRVQAVVRNANSTYNLGFARNYSESQGEYIFDVSSDNTFTRKTVGAASSSTSIGGTAYNYIRLE